jgi:hypothetical protein
VIRLKVLVEGQTEESFVNNLLAEFFNPNQINITAIILGRPGHKGGRTNYDHVKRDILVLLKQDRTAFCSTMLDFYGLGRDFPGMPISSNLMNTEKALRIEDAWKENICKEIPDFRPDIRFIPYLQLHEYEGLLFSNPSAFAAALQDSNFAHKFQAIRDEFTTPEDIDDGAESAPSKRILHLAPSYRKVIDGTLAARAVGIEKMKEECPHFRDWLSRIQAMAQY